MLLDVTPPRSSPLDPSEEIQRRRNEFLSDMHRDLERGSLRSRDAREERLNRQTRRFATFGDKQREREKLSEDDRGEETSRWDDRLLETPRGVPGRRDGKDMRPA